MTTNEGPKPKRRKLLTDAEIRRAKPQAKPCTISDGNNLRVRIMPSGRRYWQVRYMFGGVEKSFQIGVYEEGAPGPKRFGILAAREARNEIMALVEAGYDPMVVKERQETADELEAAQAKAEDAGEFSVKTLACRWIKRQQWVPGHKERVHRIFEREVYPQIGSMHVATITRDAILRLVLRPIEERGTLRTMHDLRGMLSTFYDTLEIEGYVPDGFANPATEKLSKVLLAAPKVQHQPAIIDLDQLQDFLAKCDALPGQPVTKAANRFIH
ncbi:tyrosine-type recombinase/integrase, partial [Falsiroseomonas sp. HC035]|uniref:tyrosine-type recombinase/integrase n=1 Tax=Falsiroseomonas sp. HC035 TaxID=3390999 RepID=UPI003D3137FD